MQEFKFLNYQINSQIAEIIINRPPINAFNIRLLDEILSSLELAKNDGTVRAVLIKSNLEKIFCAGLDLDILIDKPILKVREFLETIDVYALITGMDLAPLTLKEAQLMEKPVIATDVGGDKEMMIDKQTGFLVREGNSEDIIEKLRLIFEDSNLAQEMGKEGRKFVSEQFNWEFVAKNFLEIIKPHLRN